jgi:hypothetical protein
VEFATVLDGGVREAGAFVGERRHAWILRRHGRVGWAVGIDRPICSSIASFEIET